MRETSLRHHRLRRTAALLLSLLGAFGVLLGTAAPALAHAELEQTTPAAGAVLPDVPGQVALVFDEGVSVGAGAVQVYDGSRELVGSSPATQPAGHDEVVRQPLRGGLDSGTYTVTWRITSDDAHVESGSYTFIVGTPSAVTPTVPQRTDDPLAGRFVGVTRGVGYAGVAAGLGALLVAVLLWPAGLTRSATRRTVTGGLVALGLATVAAMLLQQVDATGTTLGELSSGPVLRGAPTSRFGHLMLLRLAATAAVAACACVLLRPSVGRSMAVHRWVVAALVVSGAALVASWPLVGHASTGQRAPLSLAVTNLHVTAMVVWLGGLALLLPLAVRARIRPLAQLLPRFSSVATGCVVLIVATGSYQAWREVGSFGALTGTAYGRILLAKVALVALLIGLGNLARRWVHRQYPAGAPHQRLPGLDRAAPAKSPLGAARAHAAGGGTAYAASSTAVGDPPAAPMDMVEPVQLAALRRGLAAEILTAILVLAATAALTGTATAKDAYARSPAAAVDSVPSLRFGAVAVPASRS